MPDGTKLGGLDHPEGQTLEEWIDSRGSESKNI